MSGKAGFGSSDEMSIGNSHGHCVQGPGSYIRLVVNAKVTMREEVGMNSTDRS